MLYPVRTVLLLTVREETARKYLREVEVDHQGDLGHLPSEIKPCQQSRLSYQVRRALHPLGHLLMALGERLERLGTPRTA